MKFCKDCKFCKPTVEKRVGFLSVRTRVGYQFARCTNPNVIGAAMSRPSANIADYAVAGEGGPFCSTSRLPGSDGCGVDAKHFEPVNG